MEIPEFLPEKLSYCRILKTEKELFLALTRKVDDFILFLEHACVDETWISSHLGLIKLMLRWGTKAFFLTQLPLYHARTIVKIIQTHYSLLHDLLNFRPALFYTVTFIVEEKPITVNSLLFAIASPFFLDKIKHSCFERLRDHYLLSNITHQDFKHIEEFINRGEILLLWRYSDAEIYRLMRVAKSYDLAPLVDECARILKRYITLDNVLDSLIQAHQQGFFLWKEECCHFYNNLQKGIRFIIDSEPALKVQLLDFSDDTMKTFSHLAKFITHLTFQNNLSTHKEFEECLTLCPKLIGVDLSCSSQYDDQLKKIPRQIKELNLSACPWLNDELLNQTGQYLKDIRKLYLGANPQLNYVSWGSLNLFQNLKEIDLHTSPKLNDNDLILIAKSCPNMTNLNLNYCNITDQGMIELIHTCPKLNTLNLSNCKYVTDKTMMELAEKAFELRSLTIENCPSISEKALMSLVMLRSLLRNLNMKGSSLSFTSIEQMRKSRPYIHLST